MCHGACARLAGGATGCNSHLLDLIIIINDYDLVIIFLTTINGGTLLGGRLLVRGLALGC